MQRSKYEAELMGRHPTEKLSRRDALRKLSKCFDSTHLEQLLQGSGNDSFVGGL